MNVPIHTHSRAIKQNVSLTRPHLPTHPLVFSEENFEIFLRSENDQVRIYIHKFL